MTLTSVLLLWVIQRQTCRFCMCTASVVTFVRPSLRPCCCLVKAASSGRALVLTSGSLIKWIWFLRYNFRLLSLGARSSLVSLRPTCVCVWGGAVRDGWCRCSVRECQYVQYIIYLSSCCMSAWMFLCGLLRRVKRKWLVQMENSRRSGININASLSSPAPLEHGLSPSNLL